MQIHPYIMQDTISTIHWHKCSDLSGFTQDPLLTSEMNFREQYEAYE